MLTLLKPFDQIRKEADQLAGIVRVQGTNPAAADPALDMAEKMRTADILLGDIDMQLTGEVYDTAPNLRAVVCRSIGIDFVDVEAASARGILILNSPDFCVKAVAEYAIGLMFDLARGISVAARAVEENDWERREHLQGIKLEGRTLGLVGFGKIGREVAWRAQGLGMQVIAFDPYAPAGAIAGAGAEEGDLDAVLRRADVLSIHTPLTPGTRGMIGEAEIAGMKDGAILLNVSRGGIVDEAAILKALKSGKLRGAGLDAMTMEPPREGYVLYNTGLPNLILTPHVAWNTRESGVLNTEMFVAQVRAIAEGTLPPGIVNRDIADSWMAKYGAKA